MTDWRRLCASNEWNYSRRLLDCTRSLRSVGGYVDWNEGMRGGTKMRDIRMSALAIYRRKDNGSPQEHHQ